MGTIITTRVPEGIAKDLDFFTKLERLDRSTLTRKLLAEAIEEHKIDYVLKRYKNKEISLWKAARIANIPLSRMLSILKQKGIPFNYSEKDLEDDIKSANRYAKRWLSKEVRNEILKYENFKEAILLKDAIKEEWIIIESINLKRELEKYVWLDIGELTSISLAKNKNLLILIDDETAKQIARINQVETHGTLFVLKLAYNKKFISKDATMDILNNMLEYGFYLSARMYINFVNSLK